MEQRVLYGTSDHFLNFGEVILLKWVAEATQLKPVFFNYPKGPAWEAFERRLFEPYEPPEGTDMGLAEAGLEGVEIFPFQSVGMSVVHLTLGEVVEIIRPHRRPEHRGFVVVNFHGGGRVRASSGDKLYPEFASRTLQDLLNEPNLKIGGTLIYFLYGNFLAQNSDVYTGILPHKRKDDVLGAFRVGELIAGQKAKIFQVGEIDFMTQKQWSRYYQDRKWLKVPAWVMRKFLQSDFSETVREMLLKGKYCAVAFDEERHRFSLTEAERQT